MVYKEETTDAIISDVLMPFDRNHRHFGVCWGTGAIVAGFLRLPHSPRSAAARPKAQLLRQDQKDKPVESVLPAGRQPGLLVKGPLAQELGQFNRLSGTMAN